MTCAIADGYRPFLEMSWDIDEACTPDARAAVAAWSFYTLDQDAALPGGRVGLQERFAAEAAAILVPLALARGRQLVVAMGCPSKDAEIGSRAIVA